MSVKIYPGCLKNPWRATYILERGTDVLEYDHILVTPGKHTRVSKCVFTGLVHGLLAARALGETDVLVCAQQSRMTKMLFGNLEPKTESDCRLYAFTWPAMVKIKEEFKIEYVPLMKKPQIKLRNLALAKEASMRRRAREMNQFIETVDPRAIQKRDGNICYLCTKPAYNVHFDHIIPLARGGKHMPSNVAMTCAKCNLQKHAKLPHQLDPVRRARLLQKQDQIRDIYSMLP